MCPAPAHAPASPLQTRSLAGNGSREAGCVREKLGSRAGIERLEPAAEPDQQQLHEREQRGERRRCGRVSHPHPAELCRVHRNAQPARAQHHGNLHDHAARGSKWEASARCVRVHGRGHVPYAPAGMIHGGACGQMDRCAAARAGLPPRRVRAADHLRRCNRSSSPARAERGARLSGSLSSSMRAAARLSARASLCGSSTR
eukprot:6139080-Prymnesium_polylepis.1